MLWKLLSHGRNPAQHEEHPKHYGYVPDPVLATENRLGFHMGGVRLPGIGSAKLRDVGLELQNMSSNTPRQLAKATLDISIFKIHQKKGLLGHFGVWGFGWPETSKQMRQSARRTASMEWCLYEAIRDKQRKFASEASTIGVAVDERKGHLLVTFRACVGLEVCHGILADMQNWQECRTHSSGNPQGCGDLL